MSMVELEPVAEEEDVSAARASTSRGDLETKGVVEILSDLGRGDAERLLPADRRATRASPARRAPSTSSTNWDAYLPKFRKVMPVEYRRALAELEKEQARAQVAAE